MFFYSIPFFDGVWYVWSCLFNHLNMDTHRTIEQQLKETINKSWTYPDIIELEMKILEPAEKKKNVKDGPIILEKEKFSKP